MTTGAPPIPPQWGGNGQRQPTREDVLELTEFVKSHDDSTTQLRAAIEDLADRCSAEKMALAARVALRETLEDDELMMKATQQFYHGFVELGRHDGTMWIGGKMLAALSSAMVGLGLFLIWTFGIKK